VDGVMPSTSPAARSAKVTYASAFDSGVSISQDEFTREQRIHHGDTEENGRNPEKRIETVTLWFSVFFPWFFVSPW
jgi:hypothetical protein